MRNHVRPSGLARVPTDGQEPSGYAVFPASGSLGRAGVHSHRSRERSPGASLAGRPLRSRFAVLTAILALSGVAGCGISEEEWAEEYQALWCDQIEKCGSPLECADTLSIQESGEFCEFDRANAKACLDEEAWGCDDNDFPTIPSACDEVVICSGTTGSTPS